LIPDRLGIEGVFSGLDDAYFPPTPIAADTLEDFRRWLVPDRLGALHTAPLSVPKGGGPPEGMAGTGLRVGGIAMLVCDTWTPALRPQHSIGLIADFDQASAAFIQQDGASEDLA